MQLDLDRREGGIAVALPESLSPHGEAVGQAGYNARDDGGRLHEVIAAGCWGVIIRWRHVVAGRPSLGGREEWVLLLLFLLLLLL